MGERYLKRISKNILFLLGLKKKTISSLILILKIIKKNLVDRNFVSPILFKKKTKKLLNKKKLLAGFHTRNVPHAAHQWAHRLMLEKYDDLLIQPLLGQYKRNEYLDNTIIKTNKKVLKIYKKDNLFFAPLFSYPRYGGP